MSYKIVVDSCCELPEQFKNDPHFERVPLSLQVGDYQILDNEDFNQAEFLHKVAEYPACPKSACPSPQRFLDAFKANVDRIYCIALSAALSGSYNSAMTAKNMYEDEYGDKDIYICDSQSASIGETQIAMKIMELEEKASMTFSQVVKELETFRNNMHTYFILDNLETLRKNGRLSQVKALIASTLSIKPVMSAIEGVIIQRGQAIGFKKAMNKMVENILQDGTNLEEKCLYISHCNAPERAEYLKKIFLEKIHVRKVEILDTAGVSSMYANDGGIIVAI